MTEQSLLLAGVVAPAPRRATSTSIQYSIINPGLSGLGGVNHENINCYFYVYRSNGELADHACFWRVSHI